MPPLVCPSAVFLDQSFPRDKEELRDVAASLGEIEKLLNSNVIELLLTDVLSEMVSDENWDWEQADRHPLLVEIRKFVAILFLQPHPNLLKIDVSKITTHASHPIPAGSERRGLLELWADEMGRLLHLHDKTYEDGLFRIGIACHMALCGKKSAEYESACRTFPLVGQDCGEVLKDAYDWILPEDVHRRQVSFQQAKANCFIIGATSVKKPNRGSHYKVNFPNHRPWILDYNTDPLPENFLRELETITKYPLPVIKYALTEGILPEKNLRLSNA